MLTIEVAAECDECGLYLDDVCFDGTDVDNFIFALQGWSDDYSHCPDCIGKKHYECLWCDRVADTDDIDEIGWTQFVAAGMLTLITLCNHCSDIRALVRK